MPSAEYIVRRFLAAKAPTKEVGQALKFISERDGWKRPLDVRLGPDGKPARMTPPKELKAKVWQQLLDSEYLAFSTPNEQRRATISLSDIGKAALDSWAAKTKGKLVYRRENPDMWVVELDGQQLGQWERSGDPSVRGYRRVGYQEPDWYFVVDVYDESLEEPLKKLPEKRFEGLELPQEAKKWFADQLKSLGVI